MDSLCAEQEKVLERLERAGVQGDIGPKLAEERPRLRSRTRTRSRPAISRRS